MSDSARVGSRVYTTHGTVLYVDGISRELRHGPIVSSPVNALFLPDGSHGRIMYDAGDSLQALSCSSGRSELLACAEAQDSETDDTTRSLPLEVVRLDLGLIGLRARDLFLCAEPDGRLTLSRPHCSSWEKFRLFKSPDAESSKAAEDGSAALPLKRRKVERFLLPDLNSALEKVE
jgi:hypothetical protein